jgi:hypothetical protein
MVQQQYSLQLPELWTSLVSVASFPLAYLRLQVPNNIIPKVQMSQVSWFWLVCFLPPPFVSREHLSIKEGSLFCSYEIHQTGMLQIVFLVSLESS